MKRSLGSLASDGKSEPKTSDNSTSTGTAIKKVRKDATLAKTRHQLRRGASHASSAQEYMRSEWTCDELDLSKPITPLIDFAEDRFKLVEELFSIFSIMDLKTITPEILKEYSVNQLKDICLEELNSLSMAKIKFMCEGNRVEDFVEPDIKTLDNKHSFPPIGHKSCDEFQLSVDDNEYSDFLGTENLEPKKAVVELRDAEVQANDSFFESSSDDEVDSDRGEGEGWRNIFAKNQMEILELEMRARAIRMLLKAQEDEDYTQKPFGGSNESNDNKDISVNQKNEELDTSDTNNGNEDIDGTIEDREETDEEEERILRDSESEVNKYNIEEIEENSDSKESKELSESMDREAIEEINDKQSVISDSDKCDDKSSDVGNESISDSDRKQP